MMQQYKDLINAVDIEILEEDKLHAKKKVRVLLTFAISGTVVAAAAITCAMAMLFMESMRVWTRSLAAVLIFLLIVDYTYAIKDAIKTMKILNQDCNPQKMLSRYVAQLAYLRKSSAWGRAFHQICAALSYERRYDDMKKILLLFPKYCTDDDSCFQYEYLWAKITYYEKNEEAMQMHCNYLREYVRTRGLKKKFRVIYEDAMQCPVLSQIEKEKDYARGYEIFCAWNEKSRSMLQKVMANYKMYQMAKGMGDEVKAEEHRRFVLEHGGTTSMKRELEEE